MQRNPSENLSVLVRVTGVQVTLLMFGGGGMGGGWAGRRRDGGEQEGVGKV
jgi:hypothetical protein